MSKFKTGETSKSVKEKKVAISRSMILKSQLLGKINKYDEIPGSLEMKGSTISEGAVHKWADTKLGIIAYARNSAHAKHNSDSLETLLKSISDANDRIDAALRIDSSKLGVSRKRLSDEAIDNLQKENAELKVALAEVYRAYMQILGRFREDKKIDDSFRQLLLDQARILGKNKMWEVK